MTVYVSLPLTGPRAQDGLDAADGARLALAEAGGRAGGLEVGAEYLDDARGESWDPAAVGENARAAVQDSSTAVYIGELDSQPTRASLPITNDAGIAQISPGAGAIDLTATARGYPDSPDRYRPSGEVTFARVVPDDGVVAAGLAQWAAQLGIRRVASGPAETPFASLMTEEFTEAAAGAGVEVGEGGEGTFEPGGPIGPGTLSSGGRERTTSGAVAALNLPDAGFIARFEGEFGRTPGPYAAYGYEVMALALAAIEEAEGAEGFRSAVVDAVLGAERAESVLGRFSITQQGDTTLCAVQRYELRNGPPAPLDSPCVAE